MKKNIKQQISWRRATLLLALLGLFFTAFNSCERDILEINDKFKEQVRTSLLVEVVDTAGKPMPGVQVFYGSQTLLTNLYGLAFLEEVQSAGDRLYVQARLKGYFDASKTVIPSKNSLTRIKVTMVPKNKVYFNVSTGEDFNLSNGSWIHFPDNAFVISSSGIDYSGGAYVSFLYLEPGMNDFEALMPGDMRGEDVQRNSVLLESFGMLNVEVTTTSGVPLQLKPGKKAMLKLLIAPEKLFMAQDEIPMWYFNQDRGVWEEEGKAVKRGDFYETEVGHFTWWNCDKPYPPSTITGRVLYCDLLPASGVVVTIDERQKAVTDGDGYFKAVVGAELPLFVEIRSGDNNFLVNYPRTEFMAGPANGSKHLGDFEVICSGRVTGNLVDCDLNPTPGLVVLHWDGGRSFTYVNKSGTFLLPVAADKNVLLNAFGVNGNRVQRSFTSQEFPLITAFPLLSVCDTASTGPLNAFVIDGDGHTLKWFGISSDPTKYFHTSGPPPDGGSLTWFWTNDSLGDPIWVRIRTAKSLSVPDTYHLSAPMDTFSIRYLRGSSSASSEYKLIEGTIVVKSASSGIIDADFWGRLEGKIAGAEIEVKKGNFTFSY